MTLPVSPSPARILIVEDDYFVAMLVENALIEGGYDIVGIARRGEEAIEFAASRRPDLVIMDIRLAGEIDGLSAARALAEDNIPTLFATAHGPDQRPDDLEPVGWVTKPYDENELMAAIDTALTRLASAKSEPRSHIS